MKPDTIRKLLIGLLLLACSPVFAAPLTIDVAGFQSNGTFGDTDNKVLTFNVGANSTITSLAFDVDLTAHTPSYLSEIGLALFDSRLVSGLFSTPGFINEHSGTGSYKEFIDLADFGMSFNVGNDGILRLEFYDVYDDISGADGQWNFGTITVGIETPAQEVPAPVTVLLLGAGMAAMVCTGRRRAIAPAHYG